MGRLPIWPSSGESRLPLQPSSQPQPQASFERPRTSLPFRRLDHILKHADPEGSRGGYTDWLAALSVREIMARNAVAPMERLLDFLQDGGKIREFEFFAAAATKTPVAILRDRRRELLLRDRDVLLKSKLLELEDANLELYGVDRGLTPAFRFKRRRTQFDAYLDDAGVASHMKEIASRSPKLLRRQDAETRAQRRRQILDAFLDWVSDPMSLTARDVVAAFRILGDRLSLRIAREIETEAFVFGIRTAKAFENEVASISSAISKRPIDPRILNAYFACADRPGGKGIVLVRSHPIGMQGGTSREDVLFEILALIVHEHQHFLDMDPVNRPPSARFWIELKAHAREFLWRGLYGDIQDLTDCAEASHAGFALHFRDLFEEGGPSKATPGRSLP